MGDGVGRTRRRSRARAGAGPVVPRPVRLAVPLVLGAATGSEQHDEDREEPARGRG